MIVTLLKSSKKSGQKKSND